MEYLTETKTMQSHFQSKIVFTKYQFFSYSLGSIMIMIT